MKNKPNFFLITGVSQNGGGRRVVCHLGIFPTKSRFFSDRVPKDLIYMKNVKIYSRKYNQIQSYSIFSLCHLVKFFQRGGVKNTLFGTVTISINPIKSHCQDLRLNLLAVMSPHTPALSYQVFCADLSNITSDFLLSSKSAIQSISI